MEGLFEKGIEEFNSEYFFEAHDTWEELWQDTTGPSRLFYQGLIQSAVGLYHLGNQNYKGACSQFTKALGKLMQYPAGYHGIDLDSLRTELESCLESAAALHEGRAQTFAESKIPKVRFVDDEE